MPVREDRVTEGEGQRPSVWLIDGFNLLHAGILRGRDRSGWWTAPMQMRVVERVARFESPGAELWVVFDASKSQDPPDPIGGQDSPVHVVRTPSADEWLVRRVKAAQDPGRIAVVTADRKLAARARHHGARVIPPRAFLERCPTAS